MNWPDDTHDPGIERRRFRRAFRATLVVSAFGYASQALALVSLPLFLGTLGMDGYGLMVTVMAFMGYLGFADAGLSWGSMILIAQAHGRGSRDEVAHVVRHSAVLAAASGLVAALVLAGVLLASAAGWRLPMFARHPEADRLILIAALQLGLNLQFGVFYNLFNGLQEGYWTGLYQGLGRFLGLAGAMIAAKLSHSVAAVLLVQLLLTALSGAAAALHAFRRHRWAFRLGPWFDGAQYRTQLRVGGKSFMLQIGRTLAGTAPTLAISSLFGPSAVPLYTVPTTLLGLFFAPINSWSASMQSAYGEAWVSGAVDWTRGAFRRTLERTLVFGGLGIALFLTLGDPFIRLWTHDRLRLGPAMAVSVAAIVSLSSLTSAGEFLLTGLNRHFLAAVAGVANGLLAMVLVPLALRRFGLGAVGVGVLCAGLPTSIWVLWSEITKRLGPAPFPSAAHLVRVFIALAAGVGAAHLLTPAPVGRSLSGLLHLVLGGLGGLTAFAGLALALRLVAAGEAVGLVQALRRRLGMPRPAPSAP